jgi:hypothetical protein
MDGPRPEPDAGSIPISSAAEREIIRIAAPRSLECSARLA